MVDRFRVGVIQAPFGVHGEARIFVTSDDPNRFLSLKAVHAAPPEREAAFSSRGAQECDLEILSARMSGSTAICAFRGIDTPEEVRRYRGMELWIDRSEALPLKKGEFFIADLIGLSVVTDDGRTLGTVREILPTGANHVISVRMQDGREVLLPYISDCVKEVLPEEGLIRVHLMEGLL